jgi:hypothetical protein
MPLSHASADELVKARLGADCAAVLLPRNRVERGRGRVFLAIEKRCLIRRYVKADTATEGCWKSCETLAEAETWEAALAMLPKSNGTASVKGRGF